MRCVHVFLVLLLLLPCNAVAAQAIAPTVASAEAEGREFGPRNASTEQVGAPVRPFSGSSARKCVIPPPEDSLTNGALRSGDIVARARFSGPHGFRAGKAHKVLWVPLHAVRGERVGLLLRAARIGEPSDTVRMTIPNAVYSHGASGYPSAVRLPTAGEWLIVATAGRDWGCFVLQVDE